MSMPPAGVVGNMDDEAAIQAEIEFELNNLDLDAEQDEELDDNIDAVDDLSQNPYELDLEGELGDYIKRIQEQTANFEKELEECDDLIAHTDRPVAKATSSAVIPYEDYSLLAQLAKESGCEVEQYKQKILLEIEQDEDILHDDLADLVEEESPVLEPQQSAKTGDDETVLAIKESCQSNETSHGSEAGLPVAIQKAVEEGIDPSEVPVSRELVPVDKRAEIQQMLRNQLERLEDRYRERRERIQKEEAFKRNEEDVRQRRTEEERQWKKQEIEREEKKMKEDREATQKQMEKEQKEMERQIEEQIKIFEKEMLELKMETEKQKKEFEEARKDEENRQIEKQELAASRIQRIYRGYRVRKEYKPILIERREERRKVKEEHRIQEVEEEIKERDKLKQEEQETERLKKEEDKRQKEEEKLRKEEEKRRKEEEKRQKEEEKKRKKEEEERLKQEEKKRKEEEKKRKKEEEKKRKEEEAERKREEKRLREEEEKKKKEEEKVRKEEEKRKKDEDRARQEEEKRKLEEEKKKKESDEQILKEEKNVKEKEANGVKQETAQKPGDSEVKANEDKERKEREQNENVKKASEIKPSKIDASVIKASSDSISPLNNASSINRTDQHLELNKTQTKSTSNENETITIGVYDKGQHLNNEVKTPDTYVKAQLNSDQQPVKTPRSSRTPRPPPSPKKKQVKDVSTSKEKETVENGQTKPPAPADCLPEPLEAMRLAFIKDCLPWSKISNEPWKLKGVTSRKPLRRPSSAKKLPPLTDDIILQAARVASLKQVTTVQLSDLPGNNISQLGQCWGLKYLEMIDCNLKVIEGLQQCKQLQYINVKDNKIEYVDLKDIGSLQVLDLSHNRLSTIHGLDNCTNLRWVDVSYNNITRLGGLETLRRLHTLKLSHNQLISTKGLGDTPTVQVLDVSSNHLPSVEDLDKLCLLLRLNVSSNNILKVPWLKNQVLLSELSLTDNSIASLDELSKSWLPLLQKVELAQNSVMEPECLQNCLLIKDLDLSSNQLLDGEVLKKSVEKCLYLEHLILDENPLLEEIDNSFYENLYSTLPRLQGPTSGSLHKHLPLKPRNSFEAMCLSQANVYRELFAHLEQELRLHKDSSSDLAHKCDSYFKFCDKTFKIAVEHRYAHEYGEVSVTMPTAPITPRSGRPNSARKVVQKGDTFTSPKDLFEKALQNSNKTFVVPQSSQSTEETGPKEPNILVPSAYANPKDLFEQALNSSKNLNSSNSASSKKGALTVANSQGLSNGLPVLDKLGKRASSQDIKISAAIKIQAAWRGWLVRHDISQQSKIWLAAITIQAAWRGYCVRKWFKATIEKKRNIESIDPALVEKLHTAATMIQAAWRGYSLRSKLLAALEYARFEDEDDITMDLNGDEFDLDKFMDFNEDLIDSEWRPPTTPEIPANHPILRKPPSGRPKIPPINTGDRPPSNPRRAWKNLESPMSDIQNPLGRIPRPPSSVSSGADTHRTGMSKKEEKLSEEWGFKDSSTAHLMMQRAKKMKYNSERKKKISKLDPKQRLRLFRKLQEVTQDQHIQMAPRKTLPRKEYFKDIKLWKMSLSKLFQIFNSDSVEDNEHYIVLDDFFNFLKKQDGDVKRSNVNRSFRRFKGGIKTFNNKQVVSVNSILKFIFSYCDTLSSCASLAKNIEKYILGDKKSDDIGIVNSSLDIYKLIAKTKFPNLNLLFNKVIFDESNIITLVPEHKVEFTAEEWRKICWFEKHFSNTLDSFDIEYDEIIRLKFRQFQSLRSIQECNENWTNTLKKQIKLKTLRIEAAESLNQSEIDAAQKHIPAVIERHLWSVVREDQIDEILGIAVFDSKDSIQNNVIHGVLEIRSIDLLKNKEEICQSLYYSLKRKHNVQLGKVLFFGSGSLSEFKSGDIIHRFHLRDSVLNGSILDKCIESWNADELMSSEITDDEESKCPSCFDPGLPKPLSSKGFRILEEWYLETPIETQILFDGFINRDSWRRSSKSEDYLHQKFEKLYLVYDILLNVYNKKFIGVLQQANTQELLTEYKSISSVFDVTSSAGATTSLVAAEKKLKMRSDQDLCYFNTYLKRHKLIYDTVMGDCEKEVSLRECHLVLLLDNLVKWTNKKVTTAKRSETMTNLMCTLPITLQGLPEDSGITEQWHTDECDGSANCICKQSVVLTKADIDDVLINLSQNEQNVYQQFGNLMAWGYNQLWAKMTARHDEIVQQQREKQEEYNTRASRIYEWLHMPVSNYPVTDSVINQGINQGHRSGSESNLPDVQLGKRVQLVSGPGSIELQSVDSVSTAGDQKRRYSAGSSYSSTSKLPPIQTGSAPTAKAKERMSWRNAKVNQSVGWGGGKKRGDRY